MEAFPIIAVIALIMLLLKIFLLERKVEALGMMFAEALETIHQIKTLSEKETEK